MGNLFRRFAVVVVAMGFLGAAAASDISGTISDSGGPVVGIDVRAWTLSGKRWIVASSTTTDANGDYTVSALTGGDYRVAAHSSPWASSPNRTDRWYDTTGPGYIRADADDITLSGTSNVSGIDIFVAQSYSLDIRVLESGAPVAGNLVRAELIADPSQFLGAVTFPTGTANGGDTLGWVQFRGLRPDDGATFSGEYRILVYDPQGLYETTVESGPFSGLAGVADLATADIELIDASLYEDPAEPNDSLATATAVDGAAIQAGTPFVSTGARIDPGDVDWYCWSAQAGDSYGIITSTAQWIDAAGNITDQLGGQIRYHPFVDPIVKDQSPLGGPVGDDGSAGTGPLDAHLETGVIATAETRCAIVSTFGDGGFTGTGHQSYGRYVLTIRQGNRPPTLSLSCGGLACPAALGANETDTVTVDLGYADPDGDPVTAVTAELIDGAGTVLAEGNLNAALDQWTWTTTSGDRAGSPYTVSFEACDAFECTTRSLDIVVTGPNLPPEAPILLLPADASTVQIGSAVLQVTNCNTANPNFPGCDADGDAVRVEFEVYFGADPGPNPAISPDRTGSTSLDPSGQTAFTPSPTLPAGTDVYWRARNVDALSQSAWTGFFQFFNRPNAPPTPVVLGAPFDLKCNDVVLVVDPAFLFATNASDPEGDPITAQVQVHLFAVDPDAEPPLVDETAAQTLTGTVIPVDFVALLEHGHHQIRVRACDLRRCSAWSTPCDFWMDRVNELPSALTIVTPLDDASFTNDTTIVTVTVQNGTDPDANVVPGLAMNIAWCATAGELSDCPGSRSLWSAIPQSSADPTETTAFEVPVIAGNRYLLQACIRDARGACGETDQIRFTIGELVGPLACQPGGCPAGEICDTVSLTCIPDPCLQVECAPDLLCNPSTGVCEPTDAAGCSCSTTRTSFGAWFALAALLWWRRRN